MEGPLTNEAIGDNVDDVNDVEALDGPPLGGNRLFPAAPTVEQLPPDVYPTPFHEVPYPQQRRRQNHNQNRYHAQHDQPVLFLPQDHQHVLNPPPPPSPRQHHTHPAFAPMQNHRLMPPQAECPPQNYQFLPAPNHVAVQYPQQLYHHFEQQPPHQPYAHPRLLVPPNQPNDLDESHQLRQLTPVSIKQRDPQQSQQHWQKKGSRAAAVPPVPPIAMEPRTWWDTENSTLGEPAALPPPPADFLPDPSAGQGQVPLHPHAPRPPRRRQSTSQPRPATFHPIDEDANLCPPPMPFPVATNNPQPHQPLFRYPSHNNGPQRHQHQHHPPIRLLVGTPQSHARQQYHPHQPPHQYRNPNPQPQLPRGLTPIPTQANVLPVQNTAAPPIPPPPHWTSVLNHNEVGNINDNNNNNNITATAGKNEIGMGGINDPALAFNAGLPPNSPPPTEATTTTTARPRQKKVAPSKHRATKAFPALVTQKHGSSTTKRRNCDDDGRRSGSGSVPHHDTYVLRIHDMLEDAEAKGHMDVVSWQPHGRAFKIHRPDEFYQTVLPLYFVAKRRSFVRWLRAWGFVRHTEGRDRGAYYHRYFVRGVTALVRRLTRVEMVEAMQDWLQPGECPNFYNMVAMPPDRSKMAVARQGRRTGRPDRSRGGGGGKEEGDGRAGTKRKRGGSESDGSSRAYEDEDPSDDSGDGGDREEPDRLKALDNPLRLRGSVIEDVRQMLHDAEAENFTHIVSWLPSGEAFNVYDRTAFQETIMPKYFKTPKLSHFNDGLRSWGFQRLKNERGSARHAYYHRLFQKDRPRLSRHLSKAQMLAAMVDWKDQQLMSSLAWKLHFGTFGDDEGTRDGATVAGTEGGEGGVHESRGGFEDATGDNEEGKDQNEKEGEGFRMSRTYVPRTGPEESQTATIGDELYAHMPAGGIVDTAGPLYGAGDVTMTHEREMQIYDSTSFHEGTVGGMAAGVSDGHNIATEIGCLDASGTSKGGAVALTTARTLPTAAADANKPRDSSMPLFLPAASEDPIDFFAPNAAEKMRHSSDQYFGDPYQFLQPILQGGGSIADLAPAATHHVGANSHHGEVAPGTILPNKINLSNPSSQFLDSRGNEFTKAATGQFVLPEPTSNSYTLKVHQMLEESEVDGHGHICSWRPHGRAFKIHNEIDFQEKILPRFFGAKLPNFYRWLRAWGFVRITGGWDRNCWYHRYFIRGATDLCGRLTRTQMFDAMHHWLPPGREPNFYTPGKGDIFAEVVLSSTEPTEVTEDREPSTSNADLVASVDAAATASVDHMEPHMLRGKIVEDLRKMLWITKAEGNEDIVSWQIHGKAFKVHDKEAFVEAILPRFFKSAKFSYFADTLRSWGFVRLKEGSDKGAFYHVWFVEKKPQMSLHLSRSQMKAAMREYKAKKEPDLYEGIRISKLGRMRCASAQRFRKCKTRRAAISNLKATANFESHDADSKTKHQNAATDPTVAENDAKTS